MTKTASVSLHLLFNTMPKSMNPRKNWRKIQTFHHHCRVPPSIHRYTKYDRILSIRNPYDRLASIHAMSCRTKQRKKKLDLPANSFNALLNYLLINLEKDNGKDNVDYAYRWLPIYKYIEPITNLKHIIKFESLRDDVVKLPFIQSVGVKLPRENFSSDYMSFKELATPETLEKANVWAGKDFELFNYKKYDSIGDI